MPTGYLEGYGCRLGWTVLTGDRAGDDRRACVLRSPAATASTISRQPGDQPVFIHHDPAPVSVRPRPGSAPGL
jgi:hypothetical protein